jgi:calcineurin-like phosphoesterase family protein
MNVWFTSDWHIGHRNILKYRPEFSSIEEHDNTLINNFNATVGKKDITYFLGDMVFTVEGLEAIKKLKGYKILILGNHDLLTAKEYLTVFDDIKGPIKYKGLWLTHHPMHQQELYGKPNVHGHTHNQSILDDNMNPDPRYFPVCPEHHVYKPVSLNFIKEFYQL